jgi:fused signal recognition particle receptor
MNEGRAGMLTRLFRGGNRVAEPPEFAAPDEQDAAAKSQAAPTGAATRPQQRGWFTRLRDGLTRSSSALTTGITEVFTRRRLDQAMLDQLEDLLIGADLGPATATEITERLRAERFDRDVDAAEVREFLAREIAARLEPVARPLELLPGARPHVILVVGVNGSGKTTTIGKLAAGFAGDGHRVMLAAGDTFRAAAIDQLAIWGERVGAQIVARDVGADPAGLAFDALQQARAGGADILLIDTAGRLQNKQGLMDELAKIVRVLKKIDPEAPHSVLLVLDATTGQNALSQAEIFRDVADVTGIIMTKLDGTARGGILVAIAEKFALPVHAIGIGEGIDDLGSFEPDDFARAMVGL